MSGPRIKDAHWVRQSFLVQRQELQKVDQQNRIFSTASLKFTDTTPGGNFAINPAPQFTRFADIRTPGRFVRSTKNNPGSGMGRYYSEAFDDNQQLVNIRFGVPQFNSLTTFFSGFYNSAAGQLARTGRAADAFYYAGRAGAFVVSIMSWQLLAFHSIGVGLRFFMEKPSSKFYYLKPAMPLYWNAVNTIVNHLSVNLGVVPRVLGETPGMNTSSMYEFDKPALKKLSEILPDIFKEGGGIDVYAMANRAQRLANKHALRVQQALGEAGDLTENQMAERVQRIYSESMTDAGSIGYDAYLKLWLASSPSKPREEAGGEGTTEVKPDSKSAIREYYDKFAGFLAAEMNDGSAFATFRVNATGSVQESFSNSVTESEIANKINSMSSDSRSTSFNLAGGNLMGSIPLLGTIFDKVKSFAAGVGDQLSISGLAALGGAAFVDIPKHWQSSQADLPRASYTIDLVSPYGNVVSQLLNIHIPLAMLLAGALPMSTGKQSYTSPFILELYDQGRCQTRLGMIDSLSITRGTGNLGFNSDGKVMAIQVTFSVIDMSSILHMPISENMSLGSAAMAAAAAPVGAIAGAAGGAISEGILDGAGKEGALASAALVAGAALGIVDDETTFSDYMATLAGMSLADQIYPMRRLKLNLTRKMRQWDSFFSLSHFAGWMGDTLPGRAVSAIYKGTDR